MIRVCVCGGRKFDDRTKLFRELDKLYEKLKTQHTPDIDIIVINGAATGADKLSTFWAKYNNLPYEEYPADWVTHPKAAGPIRNRQMLQTGIDILVAFEGGRGTANMVDICKKASITVIEIE